MRIAMPGGGGQVVGAQSTGDMIRLTVSDDGAGIGQPSRRDRPGLTGWAQVNGCRGETKTTEDIRRRMELDLYYVDNWSIWMDVEIIARSFFVVAHDAY